MRTFEVAANAGDSQGAIWMGGAAPLVDGGGNIWFATGNSAFGSASDPYDYSDSVIELNSSLYREQYFAPSTWPSDNAADLDLGSSSPAILAGGLVFQAGKSRTAYVLSQSALGGVGHELAVRGSYCGSTVDGGSAVSGDTVYTACLAGVVRTDVTPGNPPAITSTWRTSTGTGPPIIAGGLVWTIGGGNLYGLNPSTGVAEQAFALGSIANHFPTPSAADGLLLAPAGTRVKAFEGPGGLPPAPAPLGFVAHRGAATDISVGGKGSAWVVGRTPRPGGNFNLYRWNGLDWTLESGAVVKISVDPAGNPWAINASHQIYHLGPSGWTHLSGTATDISQGVNGSLWVIGTHARLGGFAIYHWNGAGWVAVPGGAVTIAVDPSGNPWAINDAHEIIHWVGGRFVRFPGSAEDIAVGAGGSVWVTGTNPTAGGYGIFRGIGTGWAEVPGGAVKIAVDANGYPWVVNSAGQIFSY